MGGCFVFPDGGLVPTREKGHNIVPTDSLGAEEYSMKTFINHMNLFMTGIAASVFSIWLILV